ncbi:MAG: nucleotidyltransferase family protein [Phycisphaerales bacterium]|nr:nucleotidyltransferase family protein [Phycisphaerales bacterium]
MRSSRKTGRDSRCPDAIGAGLALCLSGGGERVSHEWHRRKLWDRAACVACELGVGGFLEEETRRGGTAIPDSARDILLAHREHLRAANTEKLWRLRGVLEALRGAGVPCLLLKGAALNAALYQRLDLRGMSDVDLLIRAGDVERALTALEGIGARPEREPLHRDLFPRFYYEQPFVTADRPALRLDVHVRPFRPVRYQATVPREAMWLAPRRIECGGVSALTPGLEETLIHLCVHAAGHGLEQLRWLYDILFFLRRHGPELAVERIAAWVTAWRLAYPMRLALHCVARVFHEVPVVASVLIERLGARPGIRDWLAIRQAPRDADDPLGHVLVDTICLDGLRDRLAYLSMHLRPSDQHLSSRTGGGRLGWRWAAQGRRLLRALAKAG